MVANPGGVVRELLADGVASFSVSAWRSGSVPLKKLVSTLPEMPLTLPLSEFCQNDQNDQPSGIVGHVVV